MKHFREWYYENLGRILLLFIIIVTFTLAVVYVPYLNIVFSSLVALFIVIFSWYLLFPPSTYLLTIISISMLFFAFVASELQLSMTSEVLGEGIYIFLIFIFINYLKEVNK